MKTSIRTIVLLVLALVGCEEKRALPTITTDSGVQVTVVLMVDGVKVYRFRDHGEYVYFASSPGTVTRQNSYRDQNTNQYVVESKTTDTVKVETK